MNSIFVLAFVVAIIQPIVVYSSSEWAVYIDGGEQEAKLIAQRHGFRFIGQVQVMYCYI